MHISNMLDKFTIIVGTVPIIGPLGKNSLNFFGYLVEIKLVSVSSYDNIGSTSGAGCSKPV